MKDVIQKIEKIERPWYNKETLEFMEFMAKDVGVEITSWSTYDEFRNQYDSLYMSYFMKHFQKIMYEEM